MVRKKNVTLDEIYQKYSAPDGGGDKGTAHTYIDIYQKEMSKTSGISLLEIGVWEGHSIAMWQEYFDNSKILGIDITFDRLRFEVPVKICNATDENAIADTLADMNFDYIIDDGSHRVEDQIASQALLWDYLKVGGKYFIEDIINDNALGAIQSELESKGLNYKTYDNRHLKGRSDDILLVITKVE